MKHYENTRLTIKGWAAEDRPREKMMVKGRKHLTDAELLSILLGSGNRYESAFSLSKRILSSINNDLNELGRCSLSELMKFKGVGFAKAVTITAALELGRRRQLTNVSTRPQVCSSQDAYNVFAPVLQDLPHEEFWVLLLNRANRVIGREQVSSGGVAGTIVDAKVVFRKAIQTSACSIIMAHNHPSGNLQPSQADIDLTHKLQSAGETLDIAVLDHLIVSDLGYLSFDDEGLI